jgi:hypothetical protein
MVNAPLYGEKRIPIMVNGRGAGPMLCQRLEGEGIRFPGEDASRSVFM